MKKLVVPALIAGLAGGFAEIAWIALYSSATSTSSADVARQVTASLFASAVDMSWATWAGAGIHLALSIALGVAFVTVLWGLSSTRPSATKIWATAVVALVCVWAANFLLILPALNPVFVNLMPYAVTLTSKVLFGITMAGVLRFTVTASPG